MFDGDMMEQMELVPMEQGKEEGDDQLKHGELKLKTMMTASWICDRIQRLVHIYIACL